MYDLLMTNFLRIEDSFDDPLSNINRFFYGPILRDRFGILNKYSPYKLSDYKDPVGVQALEYKGSVKPMDQIIDEQAVKFINMDKPILLSWSGGVDSTVALIALLRNQVKKDQLHIVSAPTTEKEYPELYKYLLDEKYNLTCLDKVESLYELSKGIIITGWCADQLFGSNIHLQDKSLYNLPWLEALKKYCNKKNLYIRDYDEIYDVYTDYARRLGLVINQWCEFAWMFNFCCKWSCVAAMTKLYIVNKQARDGVYNFFENLDFQVWTLNNYQTFKEHNPELEPAYYKRPLKEYIYEFTHDEGYFLNKSKVSSVALSMKPRVACIQTIDRFSCYPITKIPFFKQYYLK